MEQHSYVCMCVGEWVYSLVVEREPFSPFFIKITKKFVYLQIVLRFTHCTLSPHDFTIRLPKYIVQYSYIHTALHIYWYTCFPIHNVKRKSGF